MTFNIISKIRNAIRGIYVVIAELPETKDIQIGRRRTEPFNKGFYGYAGSALNGLEKRLSRHLGNRKKLLWHIDYLLNIATVRKIVYAPTGQKKECLMARNLSGEFAGKAGFGCSDCNCRSHLFYCQDLGILDQAVIDSFNILNLYPLRTKDNTDHG